MAAVWTGRHRDKDGGVWDIALGLDKVAAAWPSGEETMVRMDNGGTFRILMPFWDFVLRWKDD